MCLFRTLCNYLLEEERLGGLVVRHVTFPGGAQAHSVPRCSSAVAIVRILPVVQSAGPLVRRVQFRPIYCTPKLTSSVRPVS